jgi:CheY-like chemotaxis protein
LVEPADRETDDAMFDARPIVLLIDRDDAVAALATRAIERNGARTVRVRSGTAALHLAETVHPALILLNTLLAGPIDGWQVLHGLRTRPETRNTPIAIVSVADEPLLADQLGATTYLRAPIDFGTLEQTIGRFVGTTTAVRG